jgi:hypothetical protein
MALKRMLGDLLSSLFQVVIEIRTPKIIDRHDNGVIAVYVAIQDTEMSLSFMQVNEAACLGVICYHNSSSSVYKHYCQKIDVVGIVEIMI